ncbi:MAG TPA: hypothetical protein VIJ01_20090, partial [Candidatus Angelobacter sp.]
FVTRRAGIGSASLCHSTGFYLVHVFSANNLSGSSRSKADLGAYGARPQSKVLKIFRPLCPAVKRGLARLAFLIFL